MEQDGYAPEGTLWYALGPGSHQRGGSSDPKKVLELLKAEPGPGLRGVCPPLLVQRRRHDLPLGLLQREDAVFDGALRSEWEEHGVDMGVTWGPVGGDQMGEVVVSPQHTPGF